MEYQIRSIALPEKEIIPNRRLGRNVEHDERSRNFPAEKAIALKTVSHSRHGAIFNQGNLSSCTGNAMAGALMSEPFFKNGRTLDQGCARLLYSLGTRNDSWPGGWPGTDTGSSGLAVAKAAQQVGWIKSYSHTFNLNDALGALVLRPVIIGINWYSSFTEPDAHGQLKIAPGAEVLGGHELVLRSIDVTAKTVTGDNSWGPEWGPIQGHFMMSWATLGQLLNEQGDVTVPVI